LAKAIDGLLSDSEERSRLSGNAQLAVRERFSLERMLTATEQVYREALAVKRLV
jgi:glycosyltransferase involved in cell wall biosynthesis